MDDRTFAQIGYIACHPKRPSMPHPRDTRRGISHAALLWSVRAPAPIRSKAWWLDGPLGGTKASQPRSQVHAFDARYYDIVTDRWAISASDLLLDETRISVSLAMIELKPEGVGTRLTCTEQRAFLDGFDIPDQREHGTGQLLDALGRKLERSAGRA